MPNGSWNLIERCWSRDPMDRPETAHIVDYTDQCRINDSQPTVSEKTTLSIPRPPAGSVDLTGQIFGTIGDYVAGGTFGNVYRCEWRQPYGHTVEVAVKALRFHTSEQDLRRFRRELRIWARLVHDNIVALVGTTEGFGPTAALVSLWFPDGNLLHMIAARGAGLNIRSKLQLLHGIASGLDYLHKLCVVHGDITSSNVLIDVKDGEYKACLTDFGLSTVLGESSDDTTNEDSKIQHGAIRWTAPELLIPDDHPAELKLTTKHDMYSFGRVMFHVLSLVIPWHDIDDYTIFQKILRREDISRPEISEATSDVTDARWNYIVQCWSVDPSARPSASMALDFMKSELETLKQDDVPVGEVLESHQTMPKHDIPSDFTRQISVLKLENPCTSGSFGVVYRHTIETSEGIAEVAVKVFKIDHHVRTVEEYEMAFRRQLKVWIKLSKHQTIVPLLGTANVGSAYPALVSQWMPSGTLYTYLEQGMVTASKKFELARGVADGLMYLHSEGVVHGDLHPGNVLIDGSGNARLTDFGLATVEGNAKLQLSMTSGTFNLNPRWRAPEVIGIETEHVRPNFKSDVYSFGGVMFFVSSRGIFHGKRRNTQLISSLRCRIKLYMRVPTIFLTITGT
ncbi:kinase-like domain-containing protein [Suillus cothurnatus]|nr:kinase-like domain-containing protein [Suillus cothurnatus]